MTGVAMDNVDPCQRGVYELPRTECEVPLVFQRQVLSFIDPLLHQLSLNAGVFYEPGNAASITAMMAFHTF